MNFWRYDYLVKEGHMSLPSHRRDYFNPFSHGPIANCSEFWCGNSDQWLEMHSVPERKSHYLYKDKKMYEEV